MEVNKLEKISVVNLIDICRRHMPLTRIDRQTRAALYTAICIQDITVQELINAEVSNAIQCGLVKYGAARKNKESQSGSNKRAKLNQTCDITDAQEPSWDVTMATVDMDETEDPIADFPIQQPLADATLTSVAKELASNESMICSDATPNAMSGQQNTNTSIGNVSSTDTDIRPAGDVLMARQDCGATVKGRSVASKPSIDIAEKLVASDFMNTPSQSTLDDIISRFIDATGNKALAAVPCGVCAREKNRNECEDSEIRIADIPNKHHLIPHAPHPAHELIDGLLVYAPALGSSKNTMHICKECMSQLKKNVRPRLGLSNGLWIGDIPRELQNLTLPERLLIAKYFPSAYIVKLFPKQKNAFTWDRKQMHSAMKGNVSTYQLDPRQVASMIDGKLFPPPAKILLATIGITFVGPKGLRESTMPGMFRVRRWRVREALQWLKANNPLYTDIEISESRLADLPEDGIPDKLLMTAKHSTDIEAVEREHDGYVPVEGDSDEDARHELFLEAGMTETEEGNGESEIQMEAGTIPPSANPGHAM